MELEATQRLESSTDEDDSINREDQENVVCGFLKCIDPEEFKGKEFSLVRGDNLIGRDPAKCRICFYSPSLSRVHAIVDGQRGGCTVTDQNSSNGSSLGPLKLRPSTHYALEDGSELKVGNITLIFTSVAGAEASSKNETYVPETPMANKDKNVGQQWVIPESQSSPANTPLTKKPAPPPPPPIPDSPFSTSRDQSTFNMSDGSFMAPSQPMFKSPMPPALAKETVTSESQLLDMETQRVEAPVTTEVAAASSTATSQILDAETQKVDKSDIFDVETQKVGHVPDADEPEQEKEVDDVVAVEEEQEPEQEVDESLLLEMETQAVEPLDKTADTVVMSQLASSEEKTENSEESLEVTECANNDDNKDQVNMETTAATTSVDADLIRKDSDGGVRGVIASSQADQNKTKGSQRMEIDETLEAAKRESKKPEQIPENDDEDMFDMQTQEEAPVQDDKAEPEPEPDVVDVDDAASDESEDLLAPHEDDLEIAEEEIDEKILLESTDDSAAEQENKQDEADFVMVDKEEAVEAEREAEVAAAAEPDKQQVEETPESPEGEDVFEGETQIPDDDLLEIDVEQEEKATAEDESEQPPKEPESAPEVQVEEDPKDQEEDKDVFECDTQLSDDMMADDSPLVVEQEQQQNRDEEPQEQPDEKKDAVDEGEALEVQENSPASPPPLEPLEVAEDKRDGNVEAEEAEVQDLPAEDLPEPEPENKNKDDVIEENKDEEDSSSADLIPASQSEHSSTNLLRIQPFSSTTSAGAATSSGKSLSSIYDLKDTGGLINVGKYWGADLPAAPDNKDPPKELTAENEEQVKPPPKKAPIRMSRSPSRRDDDDDRMEAEEYQSRMEQGSQLFEASLSLPTVTKPIEESDVEDSEEILGSTQMLAGINPDEPTQEQQGEEQQKHDESNFSDVEDDNHHAVAAPTQPWSWQPEEDKDQGQDKAEPEAEQADQDPGEIPGEIPLTTSTPLRPPPAQPKTSRLANKKKPVEAIAKEDPTSTSRRSTRPKKAAAEKEKEEPKPETSRRSVRPSRAKKEEEPAASSSRPTRGKAAAKPDPTPEPEPEKETKPARGRAAKKDPPPPAKSSRRSAKKTEAEPSTSKEQETEVKKPNRKSAASTKKNAEAVTTKEVSTSTRRSSRRSKPSAVLSSSLFETEDKKKEVTRGTKRKTGGSSNLNTIAEEEPAAASPAKRRRTTAAAKKPSPTPPPPRGRGGKRSLKTDEQQQQQEQPEVETKRGRRKTAPATAGSKNKKTDDSNKSSPPKRGRTTSRSSTTSTASAASKNSRASKGEREIEALNASLTGTPGQRKKSKPVVMFTGYEDPQDKKLVTELGGKLTTKAEDCTVLITDKLKRTTKLLCILGKGVPIVSPAWLAQSKMTKTFLDPWKYLIKDEESEKKWGFQLRKTLTKASKDKLLHGFKVFATTKCQPAPKELKEIVTCAGGQYLARMPTKADAGTFVISCAQDKIMADKAKKAGFPVLDKEILLTGLFRHKLDLEAHALKL